MEVGLRDHPSAQSGVRELHRRQRLRSSETGRRRLRALIGTASVFTVLFVWWLATEGLGWVGPLSLPGPVSVAERIARMTNQPYLGHSLWGHAWQSIQVVMLGWIIAGVLGAPAGILMAWSRRFRDLTYPAFQALRPISPIAWIPLAITWLGIGDSARIFIVFIAAVVPWVLNAMEAVYSIDPNLVRASKNLGSGDLGTLCRVVIPAGLPTLLGGARIALGNAWTAVIAAELLAATAGLGFIALNASRTLDSTTTVAAMVVIGVLGLLFSVIMRRVVRFIAPWASVI